MIAALYDRLARILPALLILLPGSLALIAGWHLAIPSLQLLGCLVMVTLVVAWWYPAYALSKVRLNLRQSGPAIAGDSLWLDLQAATDIESASITLLLPEPLTGAGQQQVTVAIPDLEAGQHTRLQLQARFPGLFEVQNIVITSAAPLGLVTRSRALPMNPIGIVVKPRTRPIQNLPFGDYCRSAVEPALAFNQQTDTVFDYPRYRGMRRQNETDANPAPRYQRLALPEYVLLTDAGNVVANEHVSSLATTLALRSAILEYAARGHAILHVAVDQEGDAGFITLNPHHPGLSDQQLVSVALKVPDLAFIRQWQQASVHYPECPVISIRLDSDSQNPLPEGARHLDIRLDDESFRNPMAPVREGWSQTTNQHRILILHANSNPARYL